MNMPFNFSHLMGGKKTPAQSAQPGADKSDDSADDKEKTEEEKEEDAEEEDQASASTANPAPAANSAAVAAAVQAERNRCAAIFAAPAAANNVALAAELAFSTDLSAERAIEIMGKAPKAGKDRLSEAMAGKSPRLGAEATAEPDAGAVAAGWDRAVNLANRQLGPRK
jgi:hypothetical protein